MLEVKMILIIGELLHLSVAFSFNKNYSFKKKTNIFSVIIII